MRCVTALAFAVIAGPLGVVGVAAADDRPPRALELSLAWGLARMVSPSVDRSRELSASNGGLGLAGRLVVRTAVSVSPLVEVGGAPLYRSDERLPTGSVIRSSLSESHVLGGLAFGRAWVRPWVAFGVYRLQVRSSLDGVAIDPVSWAVGYAGGVELQLVSASRVSVGLGASVLLMTEAQTAAVLAGAVIATDALRW